MVELVNDVLAVPGDVILPLYFVTKEGNDLKASFKFQIGRSNLEGFHMTASAAAVKANEYNEMSVSNWIVVRVDLVLDKVRVWQ